MNATDSIAFFFGQQGYLISDSASGSTSYNGFEDREGRWYILKSVISGATTTYTYAKGDSAYSTAWTNRASQTYAAVSTCFK